jgi:solute carrier family 25 carnitine/acylcarnitine transporter 20/29
VLEENSYTDLFMSGAVAGFVSSFIQCPTELVKIKLQLCPPGQYSGTIACVKDVIRMGGISGLFQGMAATVMREIPAFGFYFWSQKLSEDHLNSLHLPPFASSFVSGGIAGAVSWTVAYPIDVAKTEIQMVPSSTPRNQRTILAILRRIVANQGWFFLYRGLGTTILRSLPVNAVLFPTHKFCSEFLSKEFNL